VKCSTDQCAKEEAGRFYRAGFFFNHTRIERDSAPIEHTINPFERASALISTGSANIIVTWRTFHITRPQRSEPRVPGSAGVPPAMSAKSAKKGAATALKISHPTQRNL
jgi:hypothetical protein